jgi:formate hydrogenlyase transcriptional activator
MTRDGQFRRDLFYRLNVFPVHVPPLRERLEDLEMLVHHFMKKYSERFSKEVDTVESPTLDALRRWHWPGNVRELEHLVERGVILSTGRVLQLPESELGQFNEEAGNRLRIAESEMIRRVLNESHGIVGGPHGAAARLGLKRSTLQSKLKKLGL